MEESQQPSFHPSPRYSLLKNDYVSMPLAKDVTGHCIVRALMM